jgi:homogentisate 1,2-dioxygenase
MTQNNSDSNQQIIFTDVLEPALTKALKSIKARRVLLLSGSSRRYVEEVSALLDVEALEVFDGAIVHVPAAVVDRATVVLEEMKADTVISLGGGAVTGLAKALRQEHDVGFIALPTTYAGAERTPIFGITTDGVKRTGRDPRARADVVIYNVEFTLALPRKQTAQSLLNALSHPVSALSTGSLQEQDRTEALEAFRSALYAVEMLVEMPASLDARLSALRATSACAGILDKGEMGNHHSIAHRLGGRFNLDHAGLHSVLIPHTIRDLADTNTELASELHQASRSVDLPGALFDLLVRAGAETSLAGLGINASDLETFLKQEPGLECNFIHRAFSGRRPSGHVRLGDFGNGDSVASSGPSPANARLTIIALHGRGASAESILRMMGEITGDAPDIALVAPQAPMLAWYLKGYTASLDEHGEELDEALSQVQDIVDRVSAETSTDNIVLAGFSQGACLALEFLARTKLNFAGLLAFAGARIGKPEEQCEIAGDLANLPVVVGVSDADSWIARPDVEIAAEQFSNAGADVTMLNSTGDAHAITAVQRIAAREILFGNSVRKGQGGFGNTFETEALANTLPMDQNSPRHSPLGLYAEQINATGFVARRGENKRGWVYRIRPAAQHDPLKPLDHRSFRADFTGTDPEPNLCGWEPLSLPDAATDFIDGICTLGGSGGADIRRGFAVHLYAANRSMEDRSFYNADGEMILVPQEGKLTLQTELGILDVDPGMVAIIPRGLKFSVLLRENTARGYIGEVFGRGFRLPERGPVGANGLTDARHFRAPVAYHENRLAPGYRITAKFSGGLFEARQDYSPYDVVAWHGNYTPYVYELRHFCPMINGRFDHADPSIFSVLTAPLDEEGANCLDFVFFPPRWDVSEGTFRPPYFHRNAVTEINGIIRDPRGDKSPFYAGGCFITPAMTAHGIVADSVEEFLSMDEKAADRPHQFRDSSMWFQFETILPISLTPWAIETRQRMTDWPHIWGTYREHYRPPSDN